MNKDKQKNDKSKVRSKRRTQNSKLRTPNSELEAKNSRLRTRAEKKLRERTAEKQGLPIKDTQSVIHELQVYQIELEMQNEELRNTQIELEKSRKKYSDLYDFAPTGYFTFDKNGFILEVNLTGAALLQKERSPFQYLFSRMIRIYFIGTAAKYLHPGAGRPVRSGLKVIAARKSFSA